MEQRLQLAEIASGLIRRNNMPAKEAEYFVRKFFECIGENLFHDNIVKVKGLGTFKVVSVEARESVDVNTGQRIMIDEHTKVTFTPDPVLRDAINKPFAEFETVVLNENTPLEAMEAMNLNEEATQTETNEELVTVPEVQEEQLSEVDVEEQLSEKVLTQAGQPTEVVIPEEQPVAATQIEQPEDPIEKDQPEETILDIQPVEAAQEEQSVEATEDEQPVEAVPDEQPVEEEPVTTPRQRSFWRVLLPVLLSLIFFVVGYAVGYERPVSLPEWQQLFSSKKETSKVQPTRPVTKQVGKSVSKTEPVAVATPNISSDSSAVHQKKTPSRQPSEVLAYPQVEGGEYYIVGIKGTEVMKAGKTLLNISIKYYQSKDYVEYICVMNGIKNPDIVPLDKELKIPELKHK